MKLKLVFLVVNSLVIIPVAVLWFAAPHGGASKIVIFTGVAISVFLVGFLLPAFFALRKSISWTEALIIAGFPSIFWLIVWVILFTTY